MGIRYFPPRIYLLSKRIRVVDYRGLSVTAVYGATMELAKNIMGISPGGHLFLGRSH